MDYPGFDYIRNMNTLYNPKTPAAALKAVETGVLPPEAFIFRSGSVKPLFEEPYDLEEIERVLSRPGQTIDTYLLLMGILERLVSHEDPETALFAAESINAIENRCAGRIEELKETLEITDSPEILRELAVAYHDFALINGSHGVIRDFYLREAFGALKSIHGKAAFTVEDLALATQILISLGLTAHAASLLAAVERRNGPLPELLYLEAKVAFSRGDYRDVPILLRTVAGRADGSARSGIDPEILSCWSGG